MIFQPLAPIEQVAIIRACVSFYLGIGADDGWFTVSSDCHLFWCAKHPLAIFNRPPVFVHNPFHALVGRGVATLPNLQAGSTGCCHIRSTLLLRLLSCSSLPIP